MGEDYHWNEIQLWRNSTHLKDSFPYGFTYSHNQNRGRSYVCISWLWNETLEDIIGILATVGSSRPLVRDINTLLWFYALIFLYVIFQLYFKKKISYTCEHLYGHHGLRLKRVFTTTLATWLGNACHPFMHLNSFVSLTNLPLF